MLLYMLKKTPKILKTRMSSLNRSNIMMNLLTVTGKMRQKNFLIEKLKILIMTWFLRNEMITLGSLPFQHTDNLSSVCGERSITSAWFKRRLANGEEVNRSWLLYSPINKAAYCFCCLLFTSSTTTHELHLS